MALKREKEVESQAQILVVEDDAASRGLMQVFLSEYGELTFAENGTEAIEAVKKSLDDKTPFDLICMDIMMPETDGLEALKRIREVEQSHDISTANQAKVIMVTTASQESKVMRAFHYGCSGYLVKPVSKEALVKEMNKLPVRHGVNIKWRGR